MSGVIGNWLDNFFDRKIPTNKQSKSFLEGIKSRFLYLILPPHRHINTIRAVNYEKEINWRTNVNRVSVFS